MIHFILSIFIISIVFFIVWWISVNASHFNEKKLKEMQEAIDGKLPEEKPIKPKRFWRNGFLWFGVLGLFSIIFLIFF